MEARARILLIGDDDDLRLSRELILRNDGYEVESISSNQALKATPDGRFHLAVLSQSVAEMRAIRIAQSLRQRDAALRIVRVHEIASIFESSYDLNLEALTNPRDFLDALEALCDSQATTVEE